jgi:hypothetical protein
MADGIGANFTAVDKENSIRSAMAIKQKRKFKVGQVVAPTISEDGWRAGQPGRIWEIEPAGTIQLRGAKDARHWYWPKELRCLKDEEL